MKAMMDPVARRWTARATVEGGRAYVEFFRNVLVPALAHIDGHLGALVLDRALDEGVEITVLTFWESMDAVTCFAGSEPERAVVEPEARAILRDFDATVVHLRLLVDTRGE
jgi:heme-degrading monooxygenase HmoA